MERLVLVLICCTLYIVVQTRDMGNDLCFPILGDFGGLPRYPYYTQSQKKVANLLAKVTSKLKCKFIVGLGDNFYFDGVKDLADPRFFTTYERTYSDPALHVPWYMIAGNHDHNQNVTAQILYSNVSNRWKFPDFFYSIVHDIPKTKKTVELIMIDTTMLCWHNKRSGAPSSAIQWRWIEEKLKESQASFLIVAGHHPVYSAGSHGNTECLQTKLKPLLEKYRVTAYFSGHDHNLQHLKEPKSTVHYFVSGSGNFVDTRMKNRNKLPPYTLKFVHGLFGGFILACVNDNFMEVTITNDVPQKLYKLKIFPRNIFNKRINYSKSPLTNNNKLIFNQDINPQISVMPLLNNHLPAVASNPTEAVTMKVQSPFLKAQSNTGEQL